MLADVAVDADTITLPEDFADADYSIKLMLWSDLVNITPVMGSIKLTK